MANWNLCPSTITSKTGCCRFRYIAAKRLVTRPKTTIASSVTLRGRSRCIEYQYPRVSNQHLPLPCPLTTQYMCLSAYISSKQRTCIPWTLTAKQTHTLCCNWAANGFPTRSTTLANSLIQSLASASRLRRHFHRTQCCTFRCWTGIWWARTI